MTGSAMRCFYGKGETHLCSIPIFYDTKLDFVFWCSGAPEHQNITTSEHQNIRASEQQNIRTSEHQITKTQHDHQKKN
jgi:hypothetical protein